jgi:hypothetical protein
MSATDTGVGVWEKGVRAARVSALDIFVVSCFEGGWAFLCGGGFFLRVPCVVFFVLFLGWLLWVW